MTKETDDIIKLLRQLREGNEKAMKKEDILGKSVLKIKRNLLLNIEEVITKKYGVSKVLLDRNDTETKTDG